VDSHRNLRKKKPSKYYLKYSGIAFQMIAIMIFSVLFGIFLDRKFQFQNQIFTLIFALLGVVLAIGFVLIQLLKDN